MSYVFGGPTQYEGRDLGAAHRKLIREKGMAERHFCMVAGGWGRVGWGRVGWGGGRDLVKGACVGVGVAGG